MFFAVDSATNAHSIVEVKNFPSVQTPMPYIAASASSKPSA